jgi:glycosyltransferase involved in cell wall biosynthesis
MKDNILLIQPGYAHYRNQLFEILSKRHGIRVLYENALNVYPGAIRPGNYDYSFLKSRALFRPLEYCINFIKFRPEIVISSISTSYRSLLSYIYSILFQKKFILWIEEWKVRPPNKSKIKNIARNFKYLVGRHLIRKCDALVVGGSASKGYAKSMGKKEDQIFVSIQCSTDLQDTINEKAKTKNDSKQFTFLYLSRIIPRKGLDLLIHTFKRLKSDTDHVRLIIGGDGPFMEHCKRLAWSLNVRDVIFIGSIDPSSVGCLLKIADVFVFPCRFTDSDYEPWGLVVNEALSVGTPVITTLSAGAAHDLIEHQVNGLIVKENSVVDLYNAMRQVLTTDLSPMRENARRTFEKFNQFEKMADGFTKAIDHVR